MTTPTAARHLARFALVLALVPGAARPAAAADEDITAYVAAIDRAASCLEVEWHNDTLRKVCWSASTRFTVLEEEREASPDEVRVDSYLHVVGREEGGVLRAASIEIWESAAR